MENTNFTNLRFRVLPGRVFFIGIVLVVFNLAWWFAPQNAQYWIFLVGLAILSWVSSFGYRGALFVIHDLVHFLESKI